MTPRFATLRAAGRALAGALVRHLLTIAGTALVAHGYADQATVDGWLPGLTQEIAGGAIAIAGVAWSQIRAFIAHTRWHLVLDELGRALRSPTEGDDA